MSLLILTSSMASAMDCSASKNDETPISLTGEGQKSTNIDTYQFTAIEAGDGVVLIVFDRRSPSSSARSVVSDARTGQTISSSLETQDGTFILACKK